MAQRSVMKHQFSQAPTVSIGRSAFNRNHGYKTTIDAGYLIPFYVDEALPGDTFKLNSNIFARLATPIVPTMDNMVLDTFFFAVPNRLVWDNWEKFMGAQDNPDDSTDFQIPVAQNPAGGWQQGGLADYFGVPTLVGGPVEINALYHRAARLIWNEWFRDQNLQDSLEVQTGDGPEGPGFITGYDDLFRRGKRHDYFTSCLPWPQKGPAVDLPLGDIAPVTTNGLQPTITDGTIPDEPVTFRATDANASQVFGITGQTAIVNTPLYFGQETGLQADLSSATAATINSLRTAFQMQRLLERDARSGTRYVELLKAHFGVTSPDFRLQRPEYLGGGSQRINITQVPQTSPTSSDVQSFNTPQGNLAGFGTVSGTRNGFNKSFVEHSIVIGFMCVRADLTYQSGLPRMFSRQTKYDYYWPALQALGEQAVLNKEIYAQGTADDDLVFGYQERWAEYRYYPSKITNKMRSIDPQSLDYWHLSEDFATLPVLGDQFIQENPPVDRIIAVPTEPHFIVDIYNELKTVRPMPVHSVPGMIDHF